MRVVIRFAFLPIVVWAASIGSVYAQFPAILDLAELPAGEGVVFLGEQAGVAPTSQVDAGDLNGDGFVDVILAASGFGDTGFPGRVYVVFGGVTPPEGHDLVDLATLGAPNGFIIDGPSANSGLGRALITGADFNADGIDDLAIGAPVAAPLGGYKNGQVFVLFGYPGIGATGVFDLATLDGTSGFVINGRDWLDSLGSNVQQPLGALDFNVDGHPDLVVVAGNASAPGRPQCGQAYVIFGGPDMGAGGTLEVDDLDGTNGITIHGRAAYSGMGPVVVAGDVNDDGAPDLMIGAAGYSPPGRPGAGAVLVLLGGPAPGDGGVIDLAEMLATPGYAGYVIYGPEPDARVASSEPVLGDLNGDGVDDMLLNAGATGTSGAFVVFGGSDVGASGVFDLADIDGSNGFEIINLHSVDRLGDINDDGFADFGAFNFGVAPPEDGSRGVSVVAYGGPDIGSSGYFEMPREPDGDNGFTIWGAHDDDYTWVQQGLADITRDGVGELVFRSMGLRRPDGTVAGGALVVFGRSVYALGDLDRDFDVDISDFWHFAACFAGAANPPAVGCEPGVDADFDNDLDVDLSDFAIFAQNFTGAH